MSLNQSFPGSTAIAFQQPNLVKMLVRSTPGFHCKREVDAFKEYKPMMRLNKDLIRNGILLLCEEINKCSIPKLGISDIP